MNFISENNSGVRADLLHRVDVAEFIAKAGERLKELGYDAGYTSLTCQAWRGGVVTWRFRPTVYTKPNLPDIEAETLDECIAKASEWLANLRSETEMLASVLGIAAE